MKITYILILACHMCSSENSVYDWHIRTIDRSDTDFGDDLKMQTALNNERQQDLLKFSGQTNNVELNPNSVYSKSGSNENVDDVIGKLPNPLNEQIYKKHEDNGEFQSVFDYEPNKNFKQNTSSFVKENFDSHAENPQKMSVPGDNWKHSNKQPNDNTAQYEKNNKTYNKNGIEGFVGTNLFESYEKKCFSSEDVALLAIRRDFEILVPKQLPESLFDDRLVALLMNYFYICHKKVTGAASFTTRHLVQKAFYDTLGGYLNFNMVPVAKYSFYAGQISLNTAKQVLLLHKECKKFLNTNGNGWKAPLHNVLTQLKSVHIEPLHIPVVDNQAHVEPSFCMQLDMDTAENQPDNDKMIVQLPKTEAENNKGFLGNIWLPFRRKRTFDLKLESSLYIVVKFYETVTKCYRFQNIDQEFFNQQFKTWLQENINIHLSDEEFYPGLGAVLRISEFLKGSHQQHTIGIGKDSRTMLNINEKVNKYRSYKLKYDSMPKRNQTKHHSNTKEAYGKNLVFATSVRSVPKNTKYLLRTLDFSTPQIAIIAIPIIAFILVFTICCWKCFCKKKKTPVELSPVKNSSSSSSNFFNSPVRFFNIRKKSVDYSSNAAANKKNKKSVKIDKKPLISSDTSGTSSPRRKTKSKESQGSKGKTKGKDSDKSNSKSSWETTYSSK